MILNNYWKLKATCDRGNFSLTVNETSTNWGIVGFEGSMINILTNSLANGNMTYFVPNICTKRNLFARVGSGSGEPTADSYALSNDITSSISDFQYRFEITLDSGKTITTCLIGGTNNTGSSITLTEIGIGKTFARYIDNTTSEALLVIHKLEEPKTVPANTGFRLTFEWVEQ